MPPRTRRSGLRSDPLAAVIPDPAASTPAPVASEPPAASARAAAVPDRTAETPAAAKTAPAPNKPVQDKPVQDKPVKFNGYVSVDHADRARDALYVLPGEWTTGRFLEHAIDLALADLAKRYNGGKPFAKRPAGQGLRRGPRIT